LRNFFFSSRRRHTRSKRDWSSDVCSSDLTYQRHGWKLQRVLLHSATRAEINQQARELLKEARFVDADFDALWFARPSHHGREARSEERRVGKECGCRWWVYSYIE